ncbi:hypothetical protein LOK49_LG08G00494 [Camellia lanceoleosa]|uniref:Uncharacterized protein n=1 Tax=Camellia lanceoleosa TaxID=1840588 RepID=A0ACC0GUI5_9ERIC|nr:hypothetical protein LOK49_LG08G00494 [Camellia lanceoleosa]
MSSCRTGFAEPYLFTQIGRKSIGLTGDISTSRKSGTKEAKAKELGMGTPPSRNFQHLSMGTIRKAHHLFELEEMQGCLLTHGSRQARVAILGGKRFWKITNGTNEKATS